jgi:predicted amidohydrolase
LSDLGGEKGGVGVCDLDFEEMEGIRARMPVVNHRRRDVVSVVVGDGGSRMRVVDAGARSAL